MTEAPTQKMLVWIEFDGTLERIADSTQEPFTSDQVRF